MKVYKDMTADHLIAHVHTTVKDTIKKYNLIPKNTKLMVAVSGGKDSLTVMDVLAELGYKFDALCIDEGIQDYREHTIVDLKKFCNERDINLKIVSFKESYKATLNTFVEKNKISPCRICGVFRRQLLNTHAKGYDIIATGHNLDDELQSVMMNMWRGNLELAARLGPITGVVRSGFVQRIKPLYFIPEKMVRVYAILKGFDVKFVECPFAHDSFRHEIGEILNKWESKESGIKQNIIDSFLDWLPKLKEQHKDRTVGTCTVCGSPSASNLCRACSYMKSLKV